MKKIVIVPSDERQGFILEYFKNRGYECSLFEKTEDFCLADAVVLPIPSEADGMIKSTGIPVGKFTQQLKNNCVVFGFCLKNGDLSKELKKRDVSFFDVYESGELAVSNAYATAQGVLKHILNDTKKLLRETKILLSGYGRTGRAICETLTANKAPICVLARRAEYRSELREKNIKSYAYDEKEIGEGYDYIVNTVASNVIDEKIMKTLDKNGKILEIASNPYGVDFEKARSMNLQCEILPSLPSKAASESSGRFMAQAIEKIIEKNFEEGKTWKL